MKNRRKFVSILGIVMIMVLGGISIGGLNDKCPKMPVNDCQFLWGIFFVTILIGIILAEFWARHRIKEGPVPLSPNTSSGPKLSDWRMQVFRSVAWVTLSAILGGLPLIVSGSFALIVFSLPLGFFIVFVYRAIFDCLPPLKENHET